MTPKAQATGEKIDELTSSKLKTMCFKGHFQRVKNNHRMGKKIFANNITGKGPVSRIYKTCYNLTIKRQIIQLKNGQRI